MRHIDLFEQTDGHLYMVPDEGDTVFMHAPESWTDTFA
jgi:hypothetical protein